MSESIFEKGLKLDVTKHIEKKGQFNYLSWPFAVQELRRLDPKAVWEVTKFENHYENEKCFGKDELPYMKTDSGYFVEVIVTMSDGVKSQQIHPVLDNRNQPIKQPTSFQINTSIQRCLVKAIALASGIGLHIYAGEDLPPSDEQQEPERNWIAEIKTASTEEELKAIFGEAYKSTKGEEKATVKREYDKRKVEITELGGSSQAQR
jgi:hypothetical protein